MGGFLGGGGGWSQTGNYGYDHVWKLEIPMGRDYCKVCVCLLFALLAGL